MTISNTSSATSLQAVSFHQGDSSCSLRNVDTQSSSSINEHNNALGSFHSGSESGLGSSASSQVFSNSPSKNLSTTSMGALQTSEQGIGANAPFNMNFDLSSKSQIALTNASALTKFMKPGRVNSELGQFHNATPPMFTIGSSNLEDSIEELKSSSPPNQKPAESVRHSPKSEL
ncbi:hypothetical protein D5R81_01525 [Parashewanella spongiae]|uniref:Uncharacterized protein n=1 Tax=Parashewanella spongiae TaxID=342950 RepID=A0A3A6UJJ0_9GAMM|nr:hypothetical protein [Parashewanella spongiae]MCL1076773.1 hypothetical protein [Parashewanella spongiae]RJY19302.1 hypothetical protein D5R81_01525 [Parashewanella spongiae]